MAERRRGRARQAGQATLELLAGLPVLLLAGALGLQLLAVGYSLTLADGAAEAGAIAVANGLPVEDAVGGALPGWTRDRVSVDRESGEVTVRLRPPSPLASLARALEVESTAWARPPG